MAKNSLAFYADDHASIHNSRRHHILHGVISFSDPAIYSECLPEGNLAGSCFSWHDDISQASWGMDYQVINANSSGPGSFQTALINANGDPGSTITFQNNLGTINVGSLPDITGSFTINGGVGNTLSGQSVRRIFFINAPGQTVQINNLTLANG